LSSALLIRECARLAGGKIRARIGEVIPGRDLAHISCRDELTVRLHRKVFELENVMDGNKLGLGMPGPLSIRRKSIPHDKDRMAA